MTWLNEGPLVPKRLVEVFFNNRKKVELVTEQPVAAIVNTFRALHPLAEITVVEPDQKYWRMN